MSEKTYNLDTLLVLFKSASLAPQLDDHTWQVAYENSATSGDDLFAYLIDETGVWLWFSDVLTDSEVQTLTGYSISELQKCELTESNMRVWSLRDGQALLPIPFTLKQVMAFDERTGGTLSERHRCGDEIELHIQELNETNPDAAEVVRALVRRKMPEVKDRSRHIDFDYNLLANREQLLDAFEQWGLKPQWFKDLRGHQWLLDARIIKGQGQRGHRIRAMFSPYTVMLGMTGKARTKIGTDSGWRILQHKFPKVYAVYEAYDPREQTG